MSFTTRALLVFFSYIIGSIPMGVIVSSIIGGTDIRNVGSGNIGATNVYRAHGKKLGAITLGADALKGALPVLAALLLGLSSLWVCFVGLAAFLGHLYPVFLQFKGGKGVATALGIFIVLTPVAILLSVLIFALVVYKFRYVSLASLTATASMPLLVGLTGSPDEKAYILFSLVLAALIAYRHKENIKRLLNGEELKV